MNLSPDVLATSAAVVSILTMLLAAPLLLGCYVVVQRAGAITQFVWFGGIVILLAGALAAGALGVLSLS